MIIQSLRILLTATLSHFIGPLKYIFFSANQEEVMSDNYSQSHETTWRDEKVNQEKFADDDNNDDDDYKVGDDEDDSNVGEEG